MPLLEASRNSLSRPARALQLRAPSVGSTLDQSTALWRVQEILAAAIWSIPPLELSCISAPKIGCEAGPGVDVAGITVRIAGTVTVCTVVGVIRAD